MSCSGSDFQYYCPKMRRTVYFDYYQLLQINYNASEDEIKKAYRNLAKKYHPDRCLDAQKEMSKEKFKIISDAYTNLIDTDKRQIYNSFLNQMALKQKVKKQDVQGVSSLLQSCQQDELVQLLQNNFSERSTYSNQQSQYFYQKQQQQQKMCEFFNQLKNRMSQNINNNNNNHSSTCSNNTSNYGASYFNMNESNITQEDSSYADLQHTSDEAASGETEDQPACCSQQEKYSPEEMSFYLKYPLLRPSNFSLSQLNVNNQPQPESQTPQSSQQQQNNSQFTSFQQNESSEQVPQKITLTKAQIMQVQKNAASRKIVHRIKSKQPIFSTFVMKSIKKSSK